MVTGVTSFVGSHMAKALLECGYRVRGTVRDIEKAAGLINNNLKDYADTDRFELCYVPDIAATKPKLPLKRRKREILTSQGKESYRYTGDLEEMTRRWW